MNQTDTDPVDIAILRTILYGDIFDFPMTIPEIHRFLIAEQPVEAQQIEAAVSESPWLVSRVCRLNGYVALAGRDALFEIREQREAAARELLASARHYARWLARMPFVRMVVLTGALAVRNPAGAGDDLDFMVVAANDRVWLARAFVILVVRVARLAGHEVCPNYVVAESELAQKRQNLYIAHEVLQAVPMYGGELYGKLLKENAWVQHYLPNGLSASLSLPASELGRGWRLAKRLVEYLLAGAVGRRLEAWEYSRKKRRFGPAARDPHAAAEVAPGQIKGHFQDHGSRVMRCFDERLRQYGMTYRSPDSPLHRALNSDLHSGN